MANVKLAIDLGNTYTNIFMLGSGVVLSEPTVAAVTDGEKSVVKAVGYDAKKLIGKTAKATKIIFPVFEGEIINEQVTIALLNTFLEKINVKGAFQNITALFSVPCGSNFETIEKYKIVARVCGISKVHFVESPVLSALGQRIPLNDFSPCFIIDMEGGVTNIAAVSLDGIIAGLSINFGANKVSTDIIDYIAENCGLQIGLLSAEKIRKEIGSLLDNDALSTVVNGRDVNTGAPRSLSVKALNILDATKQYYDKVAEIAISVLKKLPPEVSAEIRHSGIYVSGEASKVYGLDKYYNAKFGIKINIPENELFSVALGGGVALGNPQLLKKLALQVK